MLKNRANFFQLVSNLFCVVKRGFVEPCKNVPMAKALPFSFDLSEAQLCLFVFYPLGFSHVCLLLSATLSLFKRSEIKINC
jgi:hypothetical protein